MRKIEVSDFVTNDIREALIAMNTNDLVIADAANRLLKRVNRTDGNVALSFICILGLGLVVYSLTDELAKMNGRIMALETDKDIEEHIKKNEG